MKTERRHELQTNTLAITLARWIEAAKPYSRAALALAIAVVVILFATLYLSAQNKTHVANGWQEYFEAMTAASAVGRDPSERLADISQAYVGTPVALWARLSLADMELNRGTSRVLNDKKEAREELLKAANAYQTLLAETRDQTLLERATYGLARAHEARGELEKAREEYRSIAKQWPDSVLAGAATSRVNDLERTDTKAFYDWVAKYEPPLPLAREPGQPGARPDFLKDTLDEGGRSPGGKASGAGIFNSPSGTSTTEEAATTEAPAGETPEASDKPAEPSSDQPAEPSSEPKAETPAPESK